MSKIYEKNRAKQVFVILIMHLFLAISISAEEQENIVHLAWGKWPPLYSEDSFKGGLRAHIVQEAYAAVGVTVKYQVLPWKRAYLMAKNGEIDGTAGWLKSPEREADMLYSNPIAEGCIVFFHKKETPFQWASEKDLAGWNIGSSTGYKETEKLQTFKDKGVNFNLQVVAKDLSNMKKLIAGRIDLFASNRDVGKNLLRQNFSHEIAQSITTHPKPLDCDTLHVVFPKKAPQKSQRLIDLFNDGIKKIQENGQYEKIMKDFDRGVYDKK